MRTRLLVVDDHAVVRQGMAALLRTHSDLEVVGEAVDGREAVELAKELAVDVILMDIAMPNLNGLDATREILKERPNTKVIVVTSHADQRMVREAIDAIERQSASFTSPETRALLYKTVEHVFDATIQIELTNKKSNSAFTYLKRSRVTA